MRAPQQARLLESFLHGWMRHCKPQFCLQKCDSEELCDLQAGPILMQQMLLHCHITGRQLDQRLRQVQPITKSPNKDVGAPARLSDSMCQQHSSLDL